MIRILLVRQMESQLLPGERSTLSKALGEVDKYYTTNPQSPEEHARDCERIQPTAVLLPFDFDPSIPPQAMKKGFRHIRVSAGEASILCPPKPGSEFRFKPFEA